MSLREKNSELSSSVYQPRDADPVPPLSIRMVNGRVVGVTDAEGRYFAEPACCENPLDCEDPRCWRPFPF